MLPSVAAVYDRRKFSAQEIATLTQRRYNKENRAAGLELVQG